MRNQTVLMAFFISFVFKVAAQKEGNIWYFGNHAGLDFNSGIPVALTNGANFSYDCSSSIADSNGNVLFYSNGSTVWDKNHVIMNNGNGLNGSNNGGQCVLIVPQPLSTLYYIFTVDQFVGPNGFNYNIVDISLNGGFGQVVSKNNLLFDPSTERIDAYYNCNDNSYWVVTHQWGNNTFNAYKISSTGLNTIPVTSSVGFSHAGASYNSLGQLTISPKGDKLACAVYDQAIIELFDFDINTGVVSNPQTIIGYSNAWGVAFSSDGSKLYSTKWYDTEITQFDLNAGSIANIMASATIVGTITSPGIGGYHIGYIQMGPDGKIYIAKYNDDYIAAITSPNLLGNACLFVDSAVYLGGMACNAGLARMGFPVYPKTNTILASSFCLGDTTNFNVAIQDFNSIVWNFGDPGSGINNSDTIINPIHLYQSTGVYNVYSITYYNCIVDTTFYTVTIQSKPIASITGSDTICLGDTINLYATGGNSYQWSGAVLSNDSIISISPIIQSTYILNVINGACPGLPDTFIVTPVNLQSLFTLTLDTCLKTVHFINQSLFSQNYFWLFGDASTDTASNPIHIFSDSGQYTVTLICNNICGNDTFSTSFYLPDNSNSQSNFSLTLDSCLKQITLINNSTHSTQFFWNFGDGYTDTTFSPLHTYLVQGTYQIQLLTGNSCSIDSFALSVVIPDLPFPSANFSFILDSCSNTITCANNSINGNNYYWDFGDGFIDSTSNPTHIYLNQGNYNILLIANNSCGNDSLSFPITIPGYNNQQANFSFTIDTCHLTVNFINQSLNSSSYFWNFGDSGNDTAANPTHIYSDTGQYTVSLICANICGNDTFTVNLFIPAFHYSQSNFSISLDSCLKQISLINNSINADHFLWNFGDGNIDTTYSPTHIYLIQGTYQVQLIAGNSCSVDSSVLTLFVPDLPLPNANFMMLLDSCSYKVFCTNNSINGNNYLWNFGDGFTDTTSNPIHTYTGIGTYNIFLIAYNDCGSDTFNFPIYIPDYNNLNANFSYVIDTCNLTVNFINLSSNATQYIWQFGDSSTSNLVNIIHQYSSPGNYNIILIAQNICSIDTFNQFLFIPSIHPNGDFTFQIDTCELSVVFFNSTSGVSDFHWDFGDNSFDTTTNPHHSYSQVGTYTISLILNPQSNCSDTISKKIIFDENSSNYFYLPNVFTPNSDGKNDYFEIFGNRNCIEFNLKIYNRWGSLIFETDRPFEKFWDGTFRNKKVPDGIYDYLIDGKSIHRGGAITLMR